MNIESFLFAYMRMVVGLVIALIVVFAIFGLGKKFLPGVIGQVFGKVGDLASGQSYQFNG